MPLHDVVEENCKQGATTEIKAQPLVFGLSGVCYYVGSPCVLNLTCHHDMIPLVPASIIAYSWCTEKGVAYCRDFIFKIMHFSWG